MTNKRSGKISTSGLRGVHWCNTTRKWIAKITKDKKTKTIGLFDNKLLAYDAYVAAAMSIHGEFASF